MLGSRGGSGFTALNPLQSTVQIRGLRVAGPWPCLFSLVGISWIISALAVCIHSYSIIHDERRTSTLQLVVERYISISINDGLRTANAFYAAWSSLNF